MENEVPYQSKSYIRSTHISLSINPRELIEMGLPSEKYGDIDVDSAIIRGNGLEGIVDITLLCGNGGAHLGKEKSKKESSWHLEGDEIKKFVKFYEAPILKSLGLQ